jgi:flagellar protein FliS
MHPNYSNYEKTHITTANPMKLILLLYDGAITYLKKSVEYAENNDVKNKNIYANKARDIIVELNNAINVEVGGELAQSLRRLYFFMDRHLMQANWQNEVRGLNEVIHLLSNLRGAWQDAYEQKCSFDQHAQSRAPGVTV